MLFDLCLLLRSFIFHRIFARIQNKDPTSGSGNGGGQSQFQLFSVMPENTLFYGKIYTAGSDKYDEFLGNVLPRSECGALADCSLISLSFVCRLNGNYIM